MPAACPSRRFTTGSRASPERLHVRHALPAVTYLGPRMAQSTLELRFLGQFDIRLGEVSINIPSRPAQSLLAYLALTAGTAHRRERLAGMLWPDVEDDSARAGLRQGLWRIRKALEARLPSGVQYLLADDLTVAFDARSAYWLDAAALDTPLDE